MKLPDTINERDLYWLAGLLEGEGSFTTAGRRGRSTRQPVIALGMTDEQPVKRAAQLMGSSVYSYQPRRPNSKRNYQMRVNGKNAVPWLLVLKPLLSPRRQSQIDHCLEVAEAMPGTARGERNGHAKLNPTAVKAIRWIQSNRPDISQDRIAKLYGVNQTTMSHIRTGHTWQHIL